MKPSVELNQTHLSQELGFTSFPQLALSSSTDTHQPRRVKSVSCLREADTYFKVAGSKEAQLRPSKESAGNLGVLTSSYPELPALLEKYPKYKNYLKTKLGLINKLQDELALIGEMQADEFLRYRYEHCPALTKGMLIRHCEYWIKYYSNQILSFLRERINEKN